MKIQTIDHKQYHFNDLIAGSCFFEGGHYYMKVQFNAAEYCAVNLETGETVSIPSQRMVTLVNIVGRVQNDSNT